LICEARVITELEELDQLDQKKVSASLKSHEEILDLFREVETIEQNIKNPESFDETVITPDIIGQEISQEGKTGEIIKKSHISEESLKKEKKLKFKFLSKRHKKKEMKEPKKRWFKSRKLKVKKIKEAQGELTLKKSTFTLRIDKQGNLVGLNIKKPKVKKEKTKLRFKLFKKGKGKEAKPTEQEIKGIKGIPVKIKGVFSKIKLKKSSERSGEKEGSKIAGSVGKIKGIFSKKSK